MISHSLQNQSQGTNRHLKRTKHSRFWRYLLLILIISGLFVWYKYSQYLYYLQTPVDPTDTGNVSVIIKKWSPESNTNQVDALAQKLREQNLILDADTLKLYIKFNGFDRKLVAGRFLLKRSMTIPQILEEITNIKNGEVVLTIPEGSTIKAIDEKLTNLDLIKAGEFIQATKDFQDYDLYPFLDRDANIKLPHPLEGFLFPDTYFINAGNYTNQNLIQQLLKTFQKRMAKELEGKDSKTIFETIIIASMVEKEVNSTKDLPIVAGILWKRFHENWQLGVDATLLYLKNDRTINSEDLSGDSPYNTRKNRGLPPGPISNPGLTSLKAAFNPEESPYYFYLSRPDTGETVYAVTNEEHNLNKSKYLQ